MDSLIFDRTQSDITNLTSKGYYNHTDLNRIEQWCNYLAGVLNNYNYIVNITTKTNWTMLDLPTQSKIERIRKNINTLKQAYFSFTKIPSNLDYMTCQKANDIEKILHEIDYILMWMENNFVYSGVANCGQTRTWQQRFRRINSYIVPRTWRQLTQEYWNEFAESDTWEGVTTIAENYEL
ncbi:MAG: hypothetical protein IJX99_02195 [Clostridia bacterium]|nr:hypothetical protein [Clostridia bacterium]